MNKPAVKASRVAVKKFENAVDKARTIPGNLVRRQLRKLRRLYKEAESIGEALSTLIDLLIRKCRHDNMIVKKFKYGKKYRCPDCFYKYEDDRRYSDIGEW